MCIRDSYITNALKAKELFIKDVNYIIKNHEAVIVDEFTGRVMPGRRWSDGQHQAIEAKENLKIQPETQTLASITYQNFFLLYPGLAGMTGTAKTEEVEFEKTYKLESTVIPTNQIRKRQDWSDQVFKTEIGKWKAVAKETAHIHRDGRPVLVGTTSVEKSELLSSLLSEEEIPHNLLNAKPENVEREAEIIAQAGRAGAVTIATNMAGRGTDIILGGNSDYMARLKLKEILIPLLVKPDNEHKPPIPKQRNSKAKVGFSSKAGSNLKKNISNSSTSLFPCKLDEPIEKKLSLLSDELVKNWGDRQLSVLELDDKIATAAEKAPTDDNLIKLLRESLSDVKKEYEKVLIHEEEKVR